MTDLTKRVQKCGLHTCDCAVCSISVKEAKAAIEEVKEACIDAIINNRKSTDETVKNSSGKMLFNCGLASVVEAIRNVK